jgi:flagellar basal-body rod modification protein FlgD
MPTETITSTAQTRETPEQLALRADATERIPAKSLDEDDFVRLLVTQLQQQDPFKAADTAQMMNQFVALGNFQSMQRMSAEYERVASLQLAGTAQSLVGSRVEYRRTDGTLAEGLISETRIRNGTLLFLADGTEHPVGNITRHLPAVASPTTPAAE